MSRPVKVPEALYEALLAEAERDGISVMDALQKRLCRGEETLANLREELGKAQANLTRVAAADSTRQATVRRLQGEVETLRQAEETQAQRIAGLQSEMDVEQSEAETLRSDLKDARRDAKARSRQLHMFYAASAALFAGWIAWRWWKMRKPQETAKPATPEPAELAWPARM